MRQDSMVRPWPILLSLLLAGAAAAAQPPTTPPQTPAGGPPIASQPAAGQPAIPTLTLPEAIVRAITTNPRIASARAGVSAARATRRGADAEARTDASLNVGGRFQAPEVIIKEPIVTLAPLPGLPPGSPPVAQITGVKEDFQQTLRTFDPTLHITQPVYSGGRIQANKRAGRRGERAALARQQSEAQRLVLDVTYAYLNTLEDRHQATLTAALRQLQTERLDVGRVRQTSGVALPLEVSQLEADLATSVQNEINAEARVLQDAASLNSLVGNPVRQSLALVNLPVTPTPKPPMVVEVQPRPTPEQLRAMGLDRPDLRALREDVAQADAQVQAARAARRPQINLDGSSLFRIPETLMGGFAYSLGASILQSVFDGGRNRAKVEAARAERARRAAVLAEGERDMEVQVEQARLTLDAAEQRLAAEDRRVAAATEALEVARVRLRAGTIAPYEVTEVQTTLIRAQTDANTARFEVARARANLAFVTGVAYPETVPPLINR